MPGMDERNERWKYLLGKFVANTCTRNELEELLRLVESESGSDGLSNTFRQYWAEFLQPGEMPPDVDSKFGRLMQQAKTESAHSPVIGIPKRRRRYYQSLIAAVIILALPLSIYLFYKETPGKLATPPPPKVSVVDDAAPGQNRAVLTLANGARIILDSVHNGAIARQGNTNVVKTNGALSYEGSAKTTLPLYNSIVTPKGGQYQLMLSDGSKVWLNAASALRFPAVFTGETREVELNGEAYFEVAKNAKMPFKVHLNGMNIEVLGTHFNINAYDDEVLIRATLLEGSIKINRNNVSDILRPGQQAQAGKSGNIKILKDADVEEAVAWKNGNFQFNRSDIQEIMRELKRWYDVDVDYNGTISTHFVGMISRHVNLSQVLYMLQNTGKVKFEIKGRKIIVSE